jgi:hypothetical protein
MFLPIPFLPLFSTVQNQNRYESQSHEKTGTLELTSIPAIHQQGMRESNYGFRSFKFSKTLDFTVYTS